MSDVKTVFSKKHREALDSELVNMFRRTVTNMAMPSYKTHSVLDRMIKFEHREMLKNTQEIVGDIQRHTSIYITLADMPKQRMIFHFPQASRLLPEYVNNTVVDPVKEPEFWAPLMAWRDKRIEWGARFSKVAWLLNYLDHNAGSLAAMKLYFNGITPLMAKVKGLEKRTDLTREVKMPYRMPTLEPGAREMKNECDATISTAILFDKEEDYPPRRFDLVNKTNIVVPSGEKAVW